MAAYLYAAPLGVPGTVSRPDQSIVEACGTYLPPVFGKAVKMLPVDSVAVAATAIQEGDPISAFYGVLAHSMPEASTLTDSDKPQYNQMASIFKNGYISVEVVAGTPARGQPAYLYLKAHSGHNPGDFSASEDVGAVGAADGGNTGNGTIGTVSATNPAKEGVYTITMTSATAFGVTDPDLVSLGTGSTGTQFTAGGISFKITVGGTPMVNGDKFTVTTTRYTEPVPFAAWAIDGKDANNNGELYIRR